LVCLSICLSICPSVRPSFLLSCRRGKEREKEKIKKERRKGWKKKRRETGRPSSMCVCLPVCVCCLLSYISCVSMHGYAGVSLPAHASINCSRTCVCLHVHPNARVMLLSRASNDSEGVRQPSIEIHLRSRTNALLLCMRRGCHLAHRRNLNGV